MEMEKVKKELMHMFHAWRILLGSLVKWILLSNCDWRCDRCHRQCICESDRVGQRTFVWGICGWYICCLLQVS